MGKKGDEVLVIKGGTMEKKGRGQEKEGLLDMGKEGEEILVIKGGKIGQWKEKRKGMKVKYI